MGRGTWRILHSISFISSLLQRAIRRELNSIAGVGRDKRLSFNSLMHGYLLPLWQNQPQFFRVHLEIEIEPRSFISSSRPQRRGLILLYLCFCLVKIDLSHAKKWPLACFLPIGRRSAS